VRKLLSTLFIFFFLAGSALAADLAAHFIDVGQGDSIFIVSGNNAMLIDAGNRGDGPEIIDYIKRQGFSQLDVLVGTHPHADHIGGMADIIHALNVGLIIMPKMQHNTRTFEATLDAILAKGLTVFPPVPGETFTLGAATVTILGPHRIDNKNLNNNSVALKVAVGNHAFIFMGDAEQPVEADILKSGMNISATVLDVGHHGSSTSTGAAFLKAVSPEVAVIQVGAGNKYGHPSRGVLDRLRNTGVAVYRTDIHGTVVVSVTGDALHVATEKGQGGVTTPVATPAKTGPIVTTPPVEAPAAVAFIGNQNSRIFHSPACNSLPAPANRVSFQTREQAVSSGYKPCGRCRP
jgi:competence protein ComEC